MGFQEQVPGFGKEPPENWKNFSLDVNKDVIGPLSRLFSLKNWKKRFHEPITQMFLPGKFNSKIG